MTKAPRDRDLELALEAFYEQGKHSFWDTFAQMPQQAVAVLLKRPEAFGALDPKLVGIDRRRLHARVVKLSLALLERLHPDQGS